MYSAGSIRISVNDASESAAVFGVDDCFASTGETLRSVRSLSRLDIMLRGNKFSSSALVSSDDEFDCHSDDVGLRPEGVLAKRCESFPRIDRDSFPAHCTHLLETDSMSPRLSTSSLSQYLDNELPTLAVDNLDLPSGDERNSRQTTLLTRSVSARTLRSAVGGSFQTTDRSIGNDAVVFGDRHLHSCTCISISCPSIAFSPKINHSSPTPLRFFQLPTQMHYTVTSDQQHRFTDDELIKSAAVPPKLQRRQFVTLNRDEDHLNEIVTTSYVDCSDRPILSGNSKNVNTSSPSTISRYQLPGVIFGDITISPRSASICRKHYKRPPHMADYKCMRWLQSLDIACTDH